MAWPAITSDDFQTGVLRIPQAVTDTSLQAAIDYWYPRVARRAIGVEAYNQVALPDPLPAKWLALLNGSDYICPYKGKLERWDGLMNMIRSAIFFYHQRELTRPTMSGPVRDSFSNSSLPTPEQTMGKAMGVWNDMVCQSHALIDFGYAFTDRVVAITSITGSAPTWVVNTADTALLSNGETVSIDGVDYTIANLVDNVSFEITSATPVSGDKYQFTAFDVQEFSAFDILIG